MRRLLKVPVPYVLAVLLAIGLAGGLYAIVSSGSSSDHSQAQALLGEPAPSPTTPPTQAPPASSGSQRQRSSTTAPTQAPPASAGNQSSDLAGAEAAFAYYYANALANMDRPTPPPSPAKVAELAAHLSVSCEAPQDGYYPCRVRFPGTPSGFVFCSVAVAAGRVTDARCGGTRPPQTTSRYVDCRTVGRVVTISDPTGDTFAQKQPGESGRPYGSTTIYKSAPWIDLTQAKLAISADRVCIDFTTAAAIKPQTQFILFTSPVQPPATSTEIFEPSVTISASGTPDVRLQSHGSISGQVGTHGTSTSVVINIADLPPQEQQQLRAPIQFSVDAAYTPPGGPDTAGVSDEAPNGTTRPTYP